MIVPLGAPGTLFTLTIRNALMRLGLMQNHRTHKVHIGECSHVALPPLNWPFRAKASFAARRLQKCRMSFDVFFMDVTLGDSKGRGLRSQRRDYGFFAEKLRTFFCTFGALFRFSTLNLQDVPQAELTTEEPRPEQKATLELNAGLYPSFDEALRCFDISFKFQE